MSQLHPDQTQWREAVESFANSHQAFKWATTVPDDAFDTLVELASQHPKVTVRRRASMALLPVMARRAALRGSPGEELWPASVDACIEVEPAARAVSLNRASHDALLAIFTALPEDRGRALLTPVWDHVSRGGFQSKDLGVALVAFRLSARVPDYEPAFAWLASLVNRQDLPEHSEIDYVYRAFLDMDDLRPWLKPILANLVGQGISILEGVPSGGAAPQLRPLFVRWACVGYEGGDPSWGNYNDWCRTIKAPSRAAPKKKGKRKKGSGFKR